MYNLKFEKINDNRYMVTIPMEMLDEVNKMIEILSLNDSKSYTEIINKSLRDVLLSRYISSYFFKYLSDISKLGFLIIEAKCGDDVIDISVGKTEIDKSGVKCMGWVMYN